jgi:AcrR family transcriptional regulator
MDRGMGIQERREREKAERKALIMRCARELILEYGAEKVSMRDIAKETELSKATLYLYFPGREDLFREICAEEALHFTEHFQTLLRPGLSALEMLKLYWKSYVNLFGQSDDMLMLFNMRHYLTPEYPFISIEENNDTAATPIYGFFNMIKNMIEQGIAEGVFEPDTNAAMFSHTILSVFSLIVENAAKFPGPLEAQNSNIIGEMRNIFQILLRGIAREGIDRSLLVLDSYERSVKD